MVVIICYKREITVSKTGEMAVRGFIIDVYPIYEDNPIRIEFFDDEIESIRYFDADSQKSLKNMKEIIVKPFFEFLSDYYVDEEKFGKQKYLPEFEKVISISDYFDDGVVIFKDYEQLHSSYSHICEEMITYKESKDILFNGEYMFSLDNISPKFPLYYMTINKPIKEDYDDAEMLITKSLGNGITKLQTGKYRVDFTPAETGQLEPDQYVYDLRFTLGNTVFTPLSGYINIEETVFM